MLKLAGALAIISASFFITLQILDYRDNSGGVVPAPQRSAGPQVGTDGIRGTMLEPAYNVASLPRVAANQVIAFTEGQNKEALLSGWSVSEPQGVWSLGNTAYLGFVVAGSVAPKQAIVRCMAYLVPGKLNEQRVQVWSGGKKLAEFNLKDQENEFKIPLAEAAASNAKPLILGLYLPDAKSPQGFGIGVDSRIIALYLHSLQLTP